MAESKLGWEIKKPSNGWEATKPNKKHARIRGWQLEVMTCPNHWAKHGIVEIFALDCWYLKN